MKNIIFLILFLFSNLAFTQSKNLIPNADFELGKTGWVKSGVGGFTINAGFTALFGKQSARCSGVANGDYCESKPVVVPSGLLGRDGYAEIVYQYGEPNWVFKVMNGSTVLCSNTLAKSPTKTVTLGCYFVYPTLINSTIKIRVENTSAATTEYVDFDNVSVAEAIKRSGTVSSEVQTYVPATQGLGTITSSEVYWSRNGSYLEVNGKFTVGTTSAVEARIYFPPGLTSENFTQGIRRAGEGIRVTTTSNDINVLVEPNVNYFTLDYQHDGGTNGMTKQTGANILASGNVFTFQARVKIQGWVATDSYVEQRCKSDIDCTNEFSARVFAAGSVGDLNIPNWISCSLGSGVYTCTHTPLNLSNALNCAASPEWATTATIGTVFFNRTNTGFKFTNDLVGTGTTTSVNIILNCAKTGTDYKARQTIQAYLSKPYASAWLSANFTASPTVPINFDSIEFTSQSGLIVPSATAWKFIAPEDGLYQVSVYQIDGNANSILSIFKNGTNYKNIAYKQTTYGVMGTAAPLIKLKAGDYIDIRPAVTMTINGGALAQTGASSTSAQISIVKLAD